MSAKLALCLVIQEVGGGPIDPGWGGGWGGGIGGPRPDHDLPGGGGGHPWFPGHVGGRPHPDQGLPGSGGHPSQGLPGQGGHPGNRPPGSVNLPTHPIYHPPAGTKPPAPGTSPGPGVWVVAYIPGKGFEWVAVTPGVPEKPVPGEPPSVDNTLPPEGGTTPPTTPDNTLPPAPEPKK